MINIFFIYCTFIFFFTSFYRNSILISFSFIYNIKSPFYLSIDTFKSYIFYERASEISIFSFSSLYFSWSILLQICLHFFSYWIFSYFYWCKLFKVSNRVWCSTNILFFISLREENSLLKFNYSIFIKRNLILPRLSCLVFSSVSSETKNKQFSLIY